MKNYGLMQLGLGCENIIETKGWYAKNFDFHLDVIDDENEAALMIRYTGGKIFSRRAIMTFQNSAGTGLEIWQFLSRTPDKRKLHSTLENKGIIAAIMEVEDVKQKLIESNDCEIIKSNHPIVANSENQLIRDPFGNLLLLKQSQNNINRLCGCVIGVADLQKWKSVLETFSYEATFSSDDFLKMEFQGIENPFQLQYGSSEILLVKTDAKAENLYEQRFWGDPGLIHFCFHVDSIPSFKERLTSIGMNFTVDSEKSFQMANSQGRFAYIEPEEKTLIELIEVHKA